MNKADVPQCAQEAAQRVGAYIVRVEDAGDVIEILFRHELPDSDQFQVFARLAIENLSELTAPEMTDYLESANNRLLNEWKETGAHYPYFHPDVIAAIGRALGAGVQSVIYDPSGVRPLPPGYVPGDKNVKIISEKQFDTYQKYGWPIEL